MLPPLACHLASNLANLTALIGPTGRECLKQSSPFMRLRMSSQKLQHLQELTRQNGTPSKGEPKRTSAYMSNLMSIPSLPPIPTSQTSKPSGTNLNKFMVVLLAALQSLICGSNSHRHVLTTAS